MAKVEIARSLVEEIRKTFSKAEANKVLDLIETLGKNPKKGKFLGTVGGIVIKEFKYKKFRFYFLTDGFALKMMDEEALADLLLRFVLVSDKKRPQATIEEIKDVLRKIWLMGFS